MLLPERATKPTPVKLFQFAAGVFEMRLVPYLLAVFAGKFTQFLICALITIFFGPALNRHSRSQCVDSMT